MSTRESSGAQRSGFRYDRVVPTVDDFKECEQNRGSRRWRTTSQENSSARLAAVALHEGFPLVDGLAHRAVPFCRSDGDWRNPANGLQH